MVDVVVVDDSQFMRVQLRKILEDAGHTIVGEAGDGRAAVATVADTEPDVMTMDVKMPGVDGIGAVERIMEQCPTPVVMVSRYTEEGTEATLEALEAGAIDFCPKPGGEVTSRLVESSETLVRKVETAARADLEGSIADRPTIEPTQPPEIPARAVPETPPTVVIAASAGGPPEVERILGSLPSGLGFRIVVVQHMPQAFTGRFAERLDRNAALDVSEAADTGQLDPGEAIVARGGKHLEITGEEGGSLLFELVDDPPVHNVRPAADVTIPSIVDTVSGPIVAVVCSGMGADGAAGVERVAACGGTTIVQDRQSAKVWGMPERAIETGAVDEVLPTSEIPDRILEAVRAD